MCSTLGLQNVLRSGKYPTNHVIAIPGGGHQSTSKTVRICRWQYQSSEILIREENRKNSIRAQYGAIYNYI
jgi:hypothetical protein